MQPIRSLQLASVAALIASASDLALLYSVNSQRPELALPQIGAAGLEIGGVLGAFVIPVYGLGYWAAARVLVPTSPGAARVVTLTGVGTGVVGGIIHALTAFHIHGGDTAFAAGGDPLSSMGAAGPLLPVLWGVAALLSLIASIQFAWLVGRGHTPASPALALANPALGTIVIAALGLPSIMLSSFLTPAAPNLAHLVFFVACSLSRFEGEPVRGVSPV